MEVIEKYSQHPLAMYLFSDHISSWLANLVSWNSILGAEMSVIAR